MKTITLVLLLCTLMMVGCSREKVVTVQEDEYKILIIDGCEYPVVGQGCDRMMAHKGNCSNPEHVKK